MYTSLKGVFRVIFPLATLFCATPPAMQTSSSPSVRAVGQGVENDMLTMALDGGRQVHVVLGQAPPLSFRLAENLLKPGPNKGATVGKLSG